MPKSKGTDKAVRILSLYKRLSEGKIIIKRDEAAEFDVTERTIQRDLDDIRCFMTERHLYEDIVYDHKRKGHILIQPKKNEKLF